MVVRHKGVRRIRTAAGPHPASLRSATFPKGEGIAAVKKASPLGEMIRARRGDPRSPAEKLCISDFSAGKYTVFRLSAMDFLRKSAGDQ